MFLQQTVQSCAQEANSPSVPAWFPWWARMVGVTREITAENRNGPVMVAPPSQALSILSAPGGRHLGREAQVSSWVGAGLTRRPPQTITTQVTHPAPSGTGGRSKAQNTVREGNGEGAESGAPRGSGWGPKGKCRVSGNPRGERTDGHSERSDRPGEQQSWAPQEGGRLEHSNARRKGGRGAHLAAGQRK